MCWGEGTNRKGLSKEFEFGSIKPKMHVTHPNRDKEERAGYATLEFRKEVRAGNARWGIPSI